MALVEVLDMGKTDATAEEDVDSDDSDEQDGTKARHHALTDARRTLNEHLVSVNDMSRKGWRVLQFNGIVATVVAALIPTQFTLSDFSLITVILLAIFLLMYIISTYFAYKIQRPRGVEMGPSSDVFRYAAEYDYPEDEYLAEILETYADAIDSVGRSNTESSSGLRIAVTTSAMGLASLLIALLSTLAV